MPIPPLGYLLTWTCYGTRLHGDERGTVDMSHNVIGTPTLAHDNRRQGIMFKALVHAPYLLSDRSRQIVDETIRIHCTIRRWALHALNVRTNHVHIVVTCPETISPETAMEQFKAWTTRRLREAALAGLDADVWTEHGSTRWLNNEEGFRAAVDYVLNGQ
ncbi:MAG: transposase [Planctomycetes bacterium]|nr:transposase [Planctomycetota bacterium]